jgi:hypothetical protein
MILKNSRKTDSVADGVGGEFVDGWWPRPAFALMKNNAGSGNHWLGLQLKGVTCNSDAISARVTWSAGGVTRSRLLNGGGSYLSSHDPRTILGLGKSKTCDWVEIRWPNTLERAHRYTGLKPGTYHRIVQRD